MVCIIFIIFFTGGLHDFNTKGGLGYISNKATWTLATLLTPRVNFTETAAIPHLIYARKRRWATHGTSYFHVRAFYS
jgi:hypothetical protein